MTYEQIVEVLGYASGHELMVKVVTTDRQEVLGSIQEIVSNMIGSEEMALFDVDWPREELVLVDSNGVDTALYRRVALGAGLMGAAVRPGKPLVVEASARLMGEGLLTVRLTVPLDAPDFRYRLSGSLGRMPATAFNRFLAVNEPFAFDGGWVEKIEFRQAVSGGLASTTMTPRYRDLSVNPTGDGGGIVGSVTRGARELLAQTFVVRSSNPEDPEKAPLVARTVRRYQPTSTWPQFLWLSLRDGLMEVIKQ